MTAQKMLAEITRTIVVELKSTHQLSEAEIARRIAEKDPELIRWLDNVIAAADPALVERLVTGLESH